MSSIEQRAGVTAAAGIVTGRLTGFGADGLPLVTRDPEQSAAAQPARSVVPLGPEQIGADVVLGYDRGDAAAPVILGILLPPQPIAHTLRLTAQNAIEISCGAARITLNADGKVVISGDYVISRARRTNRLEGGAVQIN